MEDHEKRRRGAIKRAGAATPGPDGIPAQAYRALGELAVDLLHGAQVTISATGGQALLEQDSPNFNESLL